MSLPPLRVIPARSGRENFKFWINGVDRMLNLQPNVTGWGVDTEFAKIGGRHEDPLQTTTHSGAQDEVAIWLNRVLTDEEAQRLWLAATTTTPPVTEEGLFQITSVARNAQGDLTISFPSTAGTTYAVDRSADNAEWVELTKTLLAAGTSTSFTDNSAEIKAGRRFFFRVRKLPAVAP